MEAIGGEDPEVQYELCCNIHIMRAVKLVAIVGFVHNIFWAPFMAFTSPVTPYDFSIVFMCLYILILIAPEKENPRLLIPYLIFNGILIGGRVIYCIVVLFTINSSWFWTQWAKDHPGSNPQTEKDVLIVHLILYIFKVFMNVWFEHIIYRGYIFMTSRGEAAPLLGAVIVRSPVQNAQPPTPPAAYPMPMAMPPSAPPYPPPNEPPGYQQI